MSTLRSLVLVALVLLLSTGVLAGQAPGASTSVVTPEADLLKYALTQGGLTLVAVLLIANELRRSGAFASALEKATAALATQAETNRQQSESFLRLARSVDSCEAVRRLVRESEEGL